MVKEQSASRLALVVFGSMLLVAAALFAVQGLPMADLAKEFGIPAGVGGWILNVVTGGGTAATIIGILIGLGTGGLGLIAAAGRATIRQFLLKQIEKRGRRAVIAW